jgi:hypothetical protein
LKAFKERFGTSEYTQIHFDLNDCLPQSIDLEDLAASFTQEEIDNIVKNLLSGKLLGLDGFNIDFMKKYWMVLSQNFYDLCS